MTKASASSALSVVNSTSFSTLKESALFSPHMLIAFNKPYGVLSQFNTNPEEEEQRTLKDFGFPKKCLPLGRLDMDSEGLLLFTDEKDLEHKLLNPKFKHRRRYLVLVEGEPDEAALNQLRSGKIVIKGHRCLPCRAKLLKSAPDFPDRDPPVRYRKNITDHWIRLELREGKNRQVRRMTAAAGHPCLRLIREGIGALPLGDLAVGEWRELTEEDRTSVFAR